VPAKMINQLEYFVELLDEIPPSSERHIEVLKNKTTDLKD
jgi:hypothetical protein